MSLRFHVTEHTVKTGPHTTFFLASGPADGPLIVFVHGWPELSISWRHQLLMQLWPAWASGLLHRTCGDTGAPSVYDQHSQYAQELIVADMIQLLDALGRDQAIFGWGTTGAAQWYGTWRAITQIGAQQSRPICACPTIHWNVVWETMCGTGRPQRVSGGAIPSRELGVPAFLPGAFLSGPPQ